MPPVVLPQASHTFTAPTGTQPLTPYAGTSFHRHENPYDRSRQDSYDMHGKMVHHRESIGTQLDKRI